MNFVHETELNTWEASADVRGFHVGISISGIYPQEDIARLAAAAIERVNRCWDSITENLLRSVFKLYNNVWADPEQGFPELLPEEFLKRLTLETISIDDDGTGASLRLSFRDGDLFGGHAILLSWPEEGQMYDAEIWG